jgi:ribosomal small subunit protein bTHX
MGKGDQRSRRGKIQVGSFGNLRPRKKRKTVLVAQSATGKATKKAAK